MTKNKNLGTKMKVIDLEKRFELMSWAVLSAINVLLLMGFMSSKSEVSNLLFSFLLCTVTLLIALLVFNSKRNLTVCRHGVHYRNLFGQCRHMHARQVQFIHHYSFFGLRLVLIMGEKYICIAPFYSLSDKQQQRLKRYDNDLFDWLKNLQKTNDFC
jgi:exosortase/archaeosortase